MERIAFFESFLEAFQFNSLIVELIVCIISPNYLFEGYIYKEYNQDYNYTITYRINDILLCFSFFRLYLVIKASLFNTIFMEPRADRLCQQMGMYVDSWFAFKCFNKHRPFFTMNWILVVTTFIFGYQLRILEGPISEVSGQDFNSLYNCIWNVIITLSSVGYGELYPKTFFGRMFAIIICFWGVFIVSFMVVIVTEFIELRGHWKECYNQIVLLTIKQGMKKQAVEIMQLCY